MFFNIFSQATEAGKNSADFAGNLFEDKEVIFLRKGSDFFQPRFRIYRSENQFTPIGDRRKAALNQKKTPAQRFRLAPLEKIQGKTKKMMKKLILNF